VIGVTVFLPMRSLSPDVGHAVGSAQDGPLIVIDPCPFADRMA
jgi:hypothetical protein